MVPPAMITRSARPIIRRLAGPMLAAATFGLGLLAVEGAARVVLARASSRPRTQRMFLRYHPTLGWDKVPNERVDLWPAEAHVVFETNAHGLRGPYRPYAKPGGAKESSSSGIRSPRGEWWRRLPSGPNSSDDSTRADADVEVLNGGTSGWSTDQELIFFREQGRLYAPDVVVLLFFSNDLDGNLSSARSPVRPGGWSTRADALPGPAASTGTAAPPAGRPATSGRGEARPLCAFWG